MKFEVRNRYTGYVQFTAEIEETENASTSVKLGLAVRWALKTKTNLRGADLSGADLSGADLSVVVLSVADLSVAVLIGVNLGVANLGGANLGGAVLREEHKAVKLLAQARRMDGHDFYLFAVEQWPAIIKAGCRMMTIADYHKHVASQYAGTEKAAETLRILDYLEACARAAAKS